MALTVRTDRKWKKFKYRDEVPKKVLASEFDYQSEDIIDGYFKHYNNWYHLDQFMRVPNGYCPGRMGRLSERFHEHRCAYQGLA